MDEKAKRWTEVKALFNQAMDKPAAQRLGFISQFEAAQDIKKEVIVLIESVQNTNKSLESLVSEASIETSQVGQVDMVIEHYRIQKLIGQGGMGEVYLAERADEQFQKLVALKLVSSRRPSPELVQRFRHERQILASLEHPNIARLLDGGETVKGAPYLVMEYVDGLPIDEYCDHHELTTNSRIRLFMNVCKAIQYAHRNLVVHRDVKASNILVDKDGQAKLLDFGIAKVLAENDVSLTQTSARILSPLHASPEQIRGATITVSSDVYSLGVLLYQLLTGLHPISGENTNSAAQIEKAICDTYPSKPSSRLKMISTSSNIESISTLRAAKPKELLKQIDGDLDNIVMKALNKEPERRYSTVQDLLEDLQCFLENRPVQARPSSISYRTHKFIQRNLANVAVSFVALSLVTSVAAFSYNTILGERDTARSAQRSAEAVSGFLQDIFESVDPAVARGETITAIELLDSGKQQIAAALVQDPSTELVMRRILAISYYTFGNTEEASKQASAGLALTQKFDIQNVAELGALTLLQAIIAQDSSDYDSAYELMNEAHQLIHQAYTAPNAKIVEVIHSQAFLQDTLGNHDEAIALYQEAISMNEVLPKDQQYEPGWSATRLSDVMRKEGKYQEGIEILNIAIALMQENYGGIHPKLSIAKRQLAMLKKDTLRYEESEALYLEILDEQKRLYEPPSEELAITYAEYSLLLVEMDKFDAAGSAAIKQMDLLDLIYAGKPNATYGAAYNNHGYFLKNIGKYAKAVESFKKSMQQQDLIGLAPDHFHRSFPMQGLAITYIKMKEYQKAEELLREVLPMRLQHMDESHLYVTQVKSSLGDALLRQGKLDEAEKWLNESLEYLRKYQNEDSKRINIVLGFLEELAELKK